MSVNAWICDQKRAKVYQPGSGRVRPGRGENWFFFFWARDLAAAKFLRWRRRILWRNVCLICRSFAEAQTETCHFSLPEFCSAHFQTRPLAAAKFCVGSGGFCGGFFSYFSAEKWPEICHFFFHRKFHRVHGQKSSW